MPYRPEFADFSLPSSFLQFPPLNGYTRPRLTLLTAKYVVVFHHLVIDHADYTETAHSRVEVSCVPPRTAIYLSFPYLFAQQRPCHHSVSVIVLNEFVDKSSAKISLPGFV